MKSYDLRKALFDYLNVIIGCMLSAFAITSILNSNGLITGGIVGISIILDKVTGMDYTYIYYALSLAVLILAWVSIGKREGLKIIFLSVLFPLVLIVFDNLSFYLIEDDMILASVYYGIIGGTGYGLILKRGFSQGGTDTIAKILHQRLFPFISISEILLGIDTSIIIASIFVFDKNVALYAIIAQIILVKTIDTVVFGLDSKKVKVEIISNMHEQIAEFILKKVKRGISTYDIKGGYMNINRLKIVTVCSPRESMLIKGYISKVDREAFVTVMPVNSVWGRGVGFDSLEETYLSDIL
jgi:uncharacterized membrane-anchored protein YitT (DUF2179 family)